jgi:polysaccharide biosynthesis protein PslH
MKILFLTTILLSKNCNGGEVASQCFIDALKHLDHEVTVIGYLRKGDKIEGDFQEILVVDERYTETSKSKLFAILWLCFSFFKSLPYSAAKYYSRSYIYLVQQRLEKTNYDCIVVDHTQLAWITNFIDNKNKLIAIAHNIEHEIYAKNYQTSHIPLAKFIYKREESLIRELEESLLLKAEQIWTLTKHDANYFSDLGGFSKTKVFGIPPNFTQLKNQKVSKCFDICLLGSWSWKANIEALEWFLQKVYPNLPTNLSIHIAGKGADWLIGKYPNIHYRGVVFDAQEFMAQAKVIAIPTLSGGGIQIKTLDAIASGSLIVATSVALRGISDPPSTVSVTEKAEEFANLLVSAVVMNSTQQADAEAKNWYQIRQDKFLQDLGSAIESIGNIKFQSSSSILK